jgi:hypothetical protein
VTFANFRENAVIVLAEICIQDFPIAEKEEQSECHCVSVRAGALLVSVNVFLV